jgi:hypothetical protein
MDAARTETRAATWAAPHEKEGRNSPFWSKKGGRKSNAAKTRRKREKRVNLGPQSSELFNCSP